jgi:hypothetical protein
MAQDGDDEHGDKVVLPDRSRTTPEARIQVLSVVETRVRSNAPARMGEFTARPLPKARHIPTPTIRDVAYAVAQYLDAHVPGTLVVANVFTYAHRPNAKESRYEAETEIELVLSDTSDNDKISRVHIGIVGKACQSIASRLWPERTIAWIYSKDLGFNYAIELNPHPNRSISIRTARAHMPDCISEIIGFHLPYEVQQKRHADLKSFIGNYVRNGSDDILSDMRQLSTSLNAGKEIRELVPYDPHTE